MVYISQQTENMHNNWGTVLLEAGTSVCLVRYMIIRP